MNSAVRFSLPQSFTDPEVDENGQPWKPSQFNEIVKQREYISRNINTSYLDTGRLSPAERVRIIQLIVDENKKTTEYIEQQTNNAKKK